MRLLQHPPRVELSVQWTNDGLELGEMSQAISEVAGATLECTPCRLRTSGTLDDMRALFAEHQPHAKSFPRDLDND